LEILSQNDSRWKNLKYNNINSTIGQDGCLITCAAMLAHTTPDKINSLLNSNGGYDSKGYVVWSKLPLEVSTGLPAICQTDIYGDMHWVLVLGKNKLQYDVIDPWSGKEILLNGNQIWDFHPYKETGVSMSDYAKEWIQFPDSATNPTKVYQWVTNPAIVDWSKVKKLKSPAKLQKQLDSVNAQLTKYQDVSDGFSNDLKTCEGDLKICQEQYCQPDMTIDEYSSAELAKALGRNFIKWINSYYMESK